MEITVRSLWTLIHGMGFGALYLMACSGALVEVFRFTSSSAPSSSPGHERLVKFYLFTMVALAWFAVLSGTYIIYPWYRAVPSSGMDISGFPQRLLLSSPATADWHSLGMEWKEHVAWLVPISITMVAAVFKQYGSELRNHKHLRAAVLCFALVSFFSAGIAGFFGAMLNKYAPVQGGHVIQLTRGSAE